LQSAARVRQGGTSLQEQYVTTYNSVMAISTIAMVPMILLFFFFQRAFIQRAFIRGIALSGLRE
jgi:ABC-type glycerol-3-phosphate transport system permease component